MKLQILEQLKLDNLTLCALHSSLLLLLSQLAHLQQLQPHLPNQTNPTNYHRFGLSNRRYLPQLPTPNFLLSPQLGHQLELCYMTYIFRTCLQLRGILLLISVNSRYIILSFCGFCIQKASRLLISGDHKIIQITLGRLWIFCTTDKLY